MIPYQPGRPSRPEHLDLRAVRYHVHRWPGQGGAPVVLLHGWMDCGATFQFLVDHLGDERAVLAPDWRGFGRSGHAPEGYWFPDYLADLDGLLEHYAGDRPVDLVGHSMGGNVACLYAGIRPQRVRRLISLEGFGLPAHDADQAPERYATWLSQLRETLRFRHYDSFEALARRLRRINPRLPDDRALFVARSWAMRDTDGRVVLRADPAHRRRNPVLYRLDEAMACWRRVAAPTLWVAGEASGIWRRYDDGEARRSCFADFRVASIPGAGHMMHHDRPDALAATIREFLGAAPD